MASRRRRVAGVIGGGAKKTLTVRRFDNDRFAPRPGARALWMSAAAAACLLGVLLAATGSSRAANPANPFDLRVPLLGPGDPVPDTSLVDQTGRTVRLSDFRGRTLIMGFVYTHCRDVCPIISEKFRKLRSLLPPDRFHLVEVSVDPARDTPRALAAYARRYGANPASWSILTGRASDLEAFWRALGVSVLAAGDEVIHNNRLVIAAAGGRISDFLDGDAWAPDDVAAQARRAAGMPASVLARWNLDLGKAVAYCGGLLAGRGGLGGLAAMLAIFAGFGYALYRVGRKIFAAPA